ncbi:unnamed protein product [Ectocarpus sp. 6 AP-2014]
MNHGTCPEGMECACCFDDIEGGTDGNYVEYRTGEGKEWRPSFFCKMCIGVLIKSQWSIYEDTLAKATCKAQQKRMLGEGPPTHVHDKTALKCEEGESVHSLWFVGDEGGEPKIQSALLEGAPQGEARQIWWDEKLAFQFDEDDDEDEAGGNTTAATTVAASTPPPVPGAPSPSPVPPAPDTDSPAAASATSNTAQAGDSTETAAASPQVARAATATTPVAPGAEVTEVDAAPSKMDVEGEEGVAPPAAPVAASAPAIPLG